ncbi:hypothetical protein SLA2020_454630 [Shorea laevis]
MELKFEELAKTTKIRLELSLEMLLKYEELANNAEIRLELSLEIELKSKLPRSTRSGFETQRHTIEHRSEKRYCLVPLEVNQAS